MFMEKVYDGGNAWLSDSFCTKISLSQNSTFRELLNSLHHVCPSFVLFYFYVVL